MGDTEELVELAFNGLQWQTSSSYEVFSCSTTTNDRNKEQTARQRWK